MRETIILLYQHRVNKFYMSPADNSFGAHDLYMHVNHWEALWAHDQYTIHIAILLLSIPEKMR